MKSALPPLLAAPLLFLAACDEAPAEQEDSATGGKAAGEVLGGTISDEMIPLGQLTSTSPPAEPTMQPDGASPGPSGEPGDAAQGEALETAPPAPVGDGGQAAPPAPPVPDSRPG